MRCTATVLLLAVLCIAAEAGQNPCAGVYLYTNPSGVGGVNHRATPPPGQQVSVWVCFDSFGWHGAPGGMRGAQWAIVETGGPTYLSTTNRYAAAGGVTTGTPNVPPGCLMTVGPDAVYPSVYGVVTLARIDYWTPGEQTSGGTIELVRYGDDGGIVVDANGGHDYWSVHDVLTQGMSGNFGWDYSVIPDGDYMYSPCGWYPSSVERSSWGSIKGLYR